MNRFYATHFIICVGLVLLPSTASAQVTDAAQRIAQALRDLGPVPVTTWATVPDHVQQICSGGTHGGERNCHDVTIYRQQATTSSRILSASSIRVISSTPVVFGSFQGTELPDRLITTSQTAQNCTQ